VPHHVQQFQVGAVGPGPGQVTGVRPAESCVQSRQVAGGDHHLVGSADAQASCVKVLYLANLVPLENGIRLVTCGSSGYQAARAYSLIRPPRTGFRRIPSLSTSVIVAQGAPGSSSGRRWAMP
jgi:hypothetical protein